jgi:hypothetical protein
VEITRSRATRRAILKVPGRSPASTSWPATSASSATASACSAPSSASPPPRARPARVVDQPRYQRLLGVGVVPVAVGLARPVVVVGAKLDRTGCRDQPTDPTDRRDQLGDRVLGGDRVLRTVESSTRWRRPASTPVASTTSRTASKTRRGRCERRIRLRQYTSPWDGTPRRPTAARRRPSSTDSDHSSTRDQRRCCSDALLQVSKQSHSRPHPIVECSSDAVRASLTPR